MFSWQFWLTVINWALITFISSWTTDDLSARYHKKKMKLVLFFNLLVKRLTSLKLTWLKETKEAHISLWKLIMFCISSSKVSWFKPFFHLITHMYKGKELLALFIFRSQGKLVTCHCNNAFLLQWKNSVSLCFYSTTYYAMVWYL